MSQEISGYTLIQAIKGRGAKRRNLRAQNITLTFVILAVMILVWAFIGEIK